MRDDDSKNFTSDFDRSIFGRVVGTKTSLEWVSKIIGMGGVEKYRILDIS